jgi:hypothetical protein
MRLFAHSDNVNNDVGACRHGVSSSQLYLYTCKDC